MKDWKELTDLTQGQKMVVERVALEGRGIAIEGQFELPALARLTSGDQIFVAAFVRTHGSIKEMERLFGVSYPTIKNRLSRIADQLEFVQSNPPPTPSEILAQVERGEITASEAVERLKP